MSQGLFIALVVIFVVTLSQIGGCVFRAINPPASAVTIINSGNTIIQIRPATLSSRPVPHP